MSTVGSGGEAWKIKRLGVGVRGLLGLWFAPIVVGWHPPYGTLEDGFPDIRTVSDGRQAIGRGWIGITPREAYLTTDVNVATLLPAWAWLLIAAGLAIAAWLIEGRKGAKAA